MEEGKGVGSGGEGGREGADGARLRNDFLALFKVLELEGVDERGFALAVCFRNWQIMVCPLAS